MIYRKQKAWHVNYVLGTHSPSKTDEFSEKFQTAFDPPHPLIFGKLCCNFFPKFMTEVSSLMAKICNINFWIENDPLPLRNFSEVGFPYLANVNIFLIDISVQYGIYLFVILPLQGS